MSLLHEDKQVTVYTVPNCLDCAAVKNLLTEAGVPYREVDISRIPEARRALEMMSGLRTVPQVYVGGKYIGQVGEVRYLIQTGRLGNAREQRSEGGTRRAAEDEGTVKSAEPLNAKTEKS